MSRTITAVDLFCGAGGTLEGLAQACDDLGHDLEVTAVNHWETAIETHRLNHEGDHYISKVEELNPTDVVAGDVDLLIASPECTHFSRARGGAPVNDQKRASPWHVLDWVEKLRPEQVLLENVRELASWGPVDDEGKPSRNGAIFESWINAFHALGYSVDWQTLNAADFGDATSRKRLFVVGRRGQRAEFPTPSHSEDGAGDTEPWRPAAEILDWSDTGESLWTRDRPLVNNTMQRIAEGIRRHCDDALEPFADAVGALDKPDVEAMQADVVAADALPAAIEKRDDPFLAELPTDTEPVEGGHPFVLGQHGGAVARDVAEPCPTVATRGAIGFYQPTAFLVPYYSEAPGQAPRSHDLNDPLPTVTATGSDPYLTYPFLVEYYGNGGSQPITDPLPTVTTKDRFALICPALFPYGLDIHFRMLKPEELAAAMGFPTDYKFAGGTKKSVTKQIGNAVPVNLSKALCEQLLTGEAPSLETFREDGEVPADD